MPKSYGLNKPEPNEFNLTEVDRIINSAQIAQRDHEPVDPYVKLLANAMNVTYDAASEILEQFGVTPLEWEPQYDN